ncbi:Fe-Mn family superoxide dismutase [Sodalis sp. CWE]|uniref:Fe-Mn family superoxide dismutase n=1 Tax=Sodalis sp. CWE TaxID=2803816 RepID=UPI001C7D80AB|nr:Fe-Mn family superoxide dismutase [Sodalis sp. CWE]MBX4180999.1 superoxide dismutase [Mn] [Sodalis sp. CWE]
MSFILPSLSYDYDALEPSFDKETMEIHHKKHHLTYINNANAILDQLPEFDNIPIDNLLQKLDKVPIKKRNELRNNVGGHFNHSFFWKGLKPGGTFLCGKLKNAIENSFGSVSKFQEFFEKTALMHFGSGWTWLIKNNETLFVTSTMNQDNPLMGENISGTSGNPIIGLDIWEHAYYLKYQNRRLDYVKSFWNVVNWDEAAVRFNS